MNQDQLQELDRVLKLWAESYSLHPDLAENGCFHEVKTYVGFREEYDYCLKCDAKKVNGQWTDSTVKN